MIAREPIPSIPAIQKVSISTLPFSEAYEPQSKLLKGGYIGDYNRGVL